MSAPALSNKSTTVSDSFPPPEATAQKSGAANFCLSKQLTRAPWLSKILTHALLALQQAKCNPVRPSSSEAFAEKK